MKRLMLFILLMATNFLAAQDLPREILGFYNSLDEGFNKPHTNFITRAAEVPLNYLGARVTLLDLADGLPSADVVERADGILLWCQRNRMPEAHRFCLWLTSVVESGIPVVLCGQIPFLYDLNTGKHTPRQDIDRLFTALGLEYVGDWTDNPLVIEILEKNNEMMDFERTLEVEDIQNYLYVKADAPTSEAYLVLGRSDLPEQRSAAVVTTPKGGYIQVNCALYIDPTYTQKRWFIDPFLFFDRAFGLTGKPRYDTTTAIGRRIFYSHIDGDGVRNESYIPGYYESGYVIFDEILTNYDLPITVSFITCELDPNFLGNQRMINLARACLSLDNVETAVHGFSHPLDWERMITAFALPGYSKEITIDDEKESEILNVSAYREGAIITVPWDDYLRTETIEAIQFIDNSFAPKEKPVSVYLWTGDCRPPAEAIELVRKAGRQNLNGGDPRFDRSYPTYTKLAPLARHVGGERQVHTSNANDNIYTHSWTGPFYGQMYVIETYEQTEYPTLIGGPPRRVSPMNLYYHFYSGERRASLYAIKLVYEYVLRRPIHPMWAGDYCDVVNGFYSGRIQELSEGGWEFSEYGACQTVRFDHEPRFPDLERSTGILGFTRWENSLYLHLTPKGSATLYFSEQPPQQPYVEDSSTPLWQLHQSRERTSFTTRGFGTVEIRLANRIPNQAYTIRVTPEGEGEEDKAVDFVAYSNQEGSLRIFAPVRGRAHVDVTATP